MGTHIYWLALAVLAVWRITHLLYGEDGPWDLMLRLRRLAGDGFWGKLLDCFYCLSLWIAAPFAFLFGEHWQERLLLWPALSGAAILLERVTAHEQPPMPLHYTEDQQEHKEEENNVLRQQPNEVENNSTLSQRTQT